ncbi:MAG TPA: hypothetical protein VGB26_02270 [Nitrospiria bacterium]
MKKIPPTVRVVAFLAFITFVFLSSQPTLACLLPSHSKMSEGKSMACCEEHCRMDTTPQVAKQNCNQSLIAFSTHPVLTGSISYGINYYVDDPSDLGHILKNEPFPEENPLRVFSSREIDSPKYNRPVKLYIVTRSLLI